MRSTRLLGCRAPLERLSESGFERHAHWPEPEWSEAEQDINPLLSQPAPFLLRRERLRARAVRSVLLFDSWPWCTRASPGVRHFS